MGQGGTLGILYVLQQTARGTQPAPSIFHAKTRQVAGAKLHVQLLAGGVDLKFPQRATTQAATAFDQGHFSKIFGVQQFRRIGAL